jgi:2-oxoglutarate ferredoxin oxidoreductase subunit alpha
VVTGLAHTRHAKVAYEPDANQEGCTMRSRKLAALHRSLRPPVVHGDPEGDLLVVGWGSTLGAIEEAVDRLRGAGERVSSVHLRFLSPLEPGLDEIFARFRRVITIEINYSDAEDDPLVAPSARRRSQLCRLLREQTLVDVHYWSVVPGHPLAPGAIADVLRPHLAAAKAAAAVATHS